jgi:hypothetical protein
LVPVRHCSRLLRCSLFISFISALPPVLFEHFFNAVCSQFWTRWHCSAGITLAFMTHVRGLSFAVTPFQATPFICVIRRCTDVLGVGFDACLWWPVHWTCLSLFAVSRGARLVCCAVDAIYRFNAVQYLYSLVQRPLTATDMDFADSLICSPFCSFCLRHAPCLVQVCCLYVHIPSWLHSRLPTFTGRVCTFVVRSLVPRSFGWRLCDRRVFLILPAAFSGPSHVTRVCGLYSRCLLLYALRFAVSGY